MKMKKIMVMFVLLMFILSSFALADNAEECDLWCKVKVILVGDEALRGNAAGWFDRGGLPLATGLPTHGGTVNDKTLNSCAAISNSGGNSGYCRASSHVFYISTTGPDTVWAVKISPSGNILKEGVDSLGSGLPPTWLWGSIKDDLPTTYAASVDYDFWQWNDDHHSECGGSSKCTPETMEHHQEWVQKLNEPLSLSEQIDLENTFTTPEAASAYFDDPALAGVSKPEVIDLITRYGTSTKAKQVIKTYNAQKKGGISGVDNYAKLIDQVGGDEKAKPWIATYNKLKGVQTSSGEQWFTEDKLLSAAADFKTSSNAEKLLGHSKMKNYDTAKDAFNAAGENTELVIALLENSAVNDGNLVAVLKTGGSKGNLVHQDLYKNVVNECGDKCKGGVDSQEPVKAAEPVPKAADADEVASYQATINTKEGEVFVKQEGNKIFWWKDGKWILWANQKSLDDVKNVYPKSFKLKDGTASPVTEAKSEPEVPEKQPVLTPKINIGDSTGADCPHLSGICEISGTYFQVEDGIVQGILDPGDDLEWKKAITLARANANEALKEAEAEIAAAQDDAAKNTAEAKKNKAQASKNAIAKAEKSAAEAPAVEEAKVFEFVGKPKDLTVVIQPEEGVFPQAEAVALKKTAQEKMLQTMNQYSAQSGKLAAQGEALSEAHKEANANLLEIKKQLSGTVDLTQLKTKLESEKTGTQDTVNILKTQIDTKKEANVQQIAQLQDDLGAGTQDNVLSPQQQEQLQTQIIALQQENDDLDTSLSTEQAQLNLINKQLELIDGSNDGEAEVAKFEKELAQVKSQSDNLLAQQKGLDAKVSIFQREIDYAEKGRLQTILDRSDIFTGDYSDREETVKGYAEEGYLSKEQLDEADGGWFGAGQESMSTIGNMMLMNKQLAEEGKTWETLTESEKEQFEDEVDFQNVMVSIKDTGLPTIEPEAVEAGSSTTQPQPTVLNLAAQGYVVNTQEGIAYEAFSGNDGNQYYVNPNTGVIYQAVGGGFGATAVGVVNPNGVVNWGQDKVPTQYQNEVKPTSEFGVLATPGTPLNQVSGLAALKINPYLGAVDLVDGIDDVKQTSTGAEIIYTPSSDLSAFQALSISVPGVKDNPENYDVTVNGEAAVVYGQNVYKESDTVNGVPKEDAKPVSSSEASKIEVKKKGLDVETKTQQQIDADQIPTTQLAPSGAPVGATAGSYESITEGANKQLADMVYKDGDSNPGYSFTKDGQEYFESEGRVWQKKGDDWQLIACKGGNCGKTKNGNDFEIGDARTASEYEITPLDSMQQIEADLQCFTTGRCSKGTKPINYDQAYERSLALLEKSKKNIDNSPEVKKWKETQTALGKFKVIGETVPTTLGGQFLTDLGKGLNVERKTANDIPTDADSAQLNNFGELFGVKREAGDTNEAYLAKLKESTGETDESLRKRVNEQIQEDKKGAADKYKEIAELQEKVDSLRWKGSWVDNIESESVRDILRGNTWLGDIGKSVQYLSGKLGSYRALSNALAPDTTAEWMEAANNEVLNTWADLDVKFVDAAICKADERMRSEEDGKTAVFVRTASGTHQFVGSIQAEKSEKAVEVLCAIDDEGARYCKGDNQICIEEFCYYDKDDDEEPDGENPVKGYYYKIYWGVTAPQDEKQTPYIDEDGKAVKFNIQLQGDDDVWAYNRKGATGRGVIELTNGASDSSIIVSFLSKNYKQVCIMFHPNYKINDYWNNPVKEICAKFEKTSPGNVEGVSGVGSSKTSSTPGVEQSI
jgi:hypothetical protein